MIDLFCGGATVGLNTNAKKIIFVDSNERIINLLIFLSKQDFDAFIKECENVIDNGVQGIVDSDSFTKGKCISLGMVGSLSPFWQESDFIASQNLLNLRNPNLNKYNALFVISCLKKLINGKHSYNRPIQKQKFRKKIIFLPAKDEKPNWQFMEDYIKSLPYADRI